MLIQDIMASFEGRKVQDGRTITIGAEVPDDLPPLEQFEEMMETELGELAEPDAVADLEDEVEQEIADLGDRDEEET